MNLPPDVPTLEQHSAHVAALVSGNTFVSPQYVISLTARVADGAAHFRRATLIHADSPRAAFSMAVEQLVQDKRETLAMYGNREPVSVDAWVSFVSWNAARECEVYHTKPEHFYSLGSLGHWRDGVHF